MSHSGAPPPRTSALSRPATAIGAHTVLVGLILVTAGTVLMAPPMQVAPGDIAPRPDPMFDSLDAWVRGVIAALAVFGALLVVAGIVLWARTGRRTFGVAMDLAIGLAIGGALLSRGSAIGILAVVVALVASATIVLVPSPMMARNNR